MMRSKHLPITLEKYEELNEADQGLCIACGAVRDCCEPDAHEYECEECGERMVYGAQELLLMGHVR